jgi:predicted ATP-grasp superfamily ATP-dependent carboligase
MRAGLLSLSGYNTRAVVALCRWAATAGVPVHLVGKAGADPIAHTAYGSHRVLVREHPALSVDDIAGWVTTLRATHGYDRVLLVPSTEFFNRVVLTHRDALEAIGALVPLVDESLYRQLSDKEAFTTLCTQHGIAVPATMSAPPADGPFVAKPRTYGNSRAGRVKPYLVLDSTERSRFTANESPDAYFYQEYVEGPSIYLLLHVSRNGTTTAMAQENLLQQRDGGSVILARAHTFHESAEADAYVRMLHSIGFHGLIMIEVRQCRRTGRAVMIEANPRLWGPMQFTLDQGVDLFTPWLADYGVATDAPRPASDPLPYYFWSGGLGPAGQPATYHAFTAESFVAEYARIAACDLFARPDSLALHRAELLAIAAS